MKISKIFHSLYFMVMFLPLFIIPIFAININQKEVDPISIEVEENELVDFNQLVYWRFPNDTYTTDGITFTNNQDGTFTMNGTNLSAWTDTSYRSPFLVNLPRDNNNYKSVYAQILSNGKWTMSTLGQGYAGSFYEFSTTEDKTYNLLYGAYYTSIIMPINTTFNNEIFYIPNLFNLTQMGLQDLTASEFKTLFPKPYYDYTESQKVLVNLGTITYDNTDIGSQFLYSIYKPVNDYFNFKQYFGMNAVYDWFQLNFFNGSAPLPFFIFFNLMLYWLIISILWILLDLMVYVPLMIHRWMDKAAIE